MVKADLKLMNVALNPKFRQMSTVIFQSFMTPKHCCNHEKNEPKCFTIE